MRPSYLNCFDKENKFQKDQYYPQLRDYSKQGVSPAKSKYEDLGPLYRRNGTSYGLNYLSPYNEKETSYRDIRQEDRKRCSPFEPHDNHQFVWRGSNECEIGDKYSKKMEREDYYPKKGYYQDDSFQNKGEAQMTTVFRKEQARNKGIEMKMNNIESISDKIGSLLSLVKGNRTPQKNRQIQQEGSPQFEKGHDRKKQACNDYKWKRERVKTAIDFEKEEKGQYYNDSLDQDNTSRKPERTNCGLIYEPSLSLKYRPEQETKIGRSKTNGFLREDKVNRSISRNERKNAFQGYTFDHYDSREKMKRQNFDEVGYNLKRGYKYEYEQNQETMIPVSLQGSKQHTPRKNIGPNLIDQKLRKIQEKIAESQSGKNKIQKRLQQKVKENQGEHYDGYKSGKLYKRSEAHQSQEFQLKVYPVKVDRENIAKVAVALLQQSELDAKLRQHREEFLKDQSESKWRQLQSKLKKRGVTKTQKDLKEIISISPEEFSLLQNYEQQPEGSLQQLLVQTELHWQNKVKGCVYRRALKNEQFKEDEVDSERKGYISQQDLKSFINHYTGRNLLVRDVSLIFRRMKLEDNMKNIEGIGFPTFMKVIAI